MSFITVADAETILGADFTALPDSEKARLVLLANTWMKNEIGYVPDPVDPLLQIAACEIIKGIQAGDLYSGIERETTSERVKADTVETQETFTAGTRTISQYEQIAKELIKSLGLYTGGFSFEVFRG